MREIIANYALFIGCVMIHRKLYIMYIVVQILIVGSPMSDAVLLLMSINSLMLSALTMLWFVHRTDAYLKK